MDTLITVLADYQILLENLEEQNWFLEPKQNLCSNKQGKKAFALSATKGFWILIKAKNYYKMNI